jgi:hypothetical protein
MKLFTEYPETEESKYYELVIAQVNQQMDKLYGSKTLEVKRDTHAKTHAAVKATLEIFDIDDQKLKNELSKRISLADNQLETISFKQGIFATPKQYPVWLRFANGRTKVMDDYVPDARSMSVKIMGVEGERLSQSHELKTQDLIVQNAEIFFIKTIQDYYGFFKAVVESEDAAKKWLKSHPRQFLALLKTTSRTPKSLLTEQYWSGSASSLGLNNNFDVSQPGKVPVTYPLVVKYGFIPISKTSNKPIPFQPRQGINKLPILNIELPFKESDRAKALGINPTIPDNYYRQEMIQSLAKSDAEYGWDFAIQVQVSPTMSIDDVTIPWSTKDSPFISMGRLTVESQNIDFNEQADFAENLRFSPWNGLAIHRPVGALNRLRSVVYPIVAEYRHKKRNVNYQEPNE